MLDLLTMMNSDIKRLVLEALKVSVSKPKQMAFLRSFAKSSGAAQRLREENEKKGLHVPPFLICSITSNCNLFCAGCYARANQACEASGAGKPLNAGRWEELFAEAKELGVSFILLAGGEPMLRQDVLSAAARHPEIVFPVFTNGTLMDAKMLELFDGSRNLVPVLSIEGEKAATDSRRGAGVYDKLTEAMKELKARKILFGASITVTRSNVADVTDEAFVKKLKKSGCGLVFYVEYVPSDMVSAELAPTDTERKLLAARLVDLKERINIMAISFPGDEKDYGGCLAAGRGFVHVNMDGRVEPCPFSPYSDTSLAGMPLTEALKSPFLTRMREGGMLAGEHDGGCLLFDKKLEVEKLLNECKDQTA